MAVPELLSYSTDDILNLFRSAYFDQHGTPMIIGSDDYAASAAFSYVLGVLVNAMNAAGNQRFLESATGAWLDTMAAIFGLSRPPAKPASALFHLTKASNGTIAAGDLIVSNEDASFSFTNLEPLYIKQDCDVILYCTQTGTVGNGIAAGALTEVYSTEVAAAVNRTITGGGFDGFPYTPEGDAGFREYIGKRKAEFTVGGSAPAYRSKALTVDSRLHDVYVAQDGDATFEKGKVKIYALWDKSTLNTALENMLNAEIKSACDARDFRAIGDLIEVYTATGIVYIPGIKVIYPLKFQNVAVSHYLACMQQYKTYLNSGFNRAYSESELAKIFITPDANGVYALAYDDSNEHAKYLAPGAGSYINLTAYASNDLDDYTSRGYFVFIDTGE